MVYACFSNVCVWLAYAIRGDDAGGRSLSVLLGLYIILPPLEAVAAFCEIPFRDLSIMLTTLGLGLEEVGFLKRWLNSQLHDRSDNRLIGLHRLLLKVHYYIILPARFC